VNPAGLARLGATVSWKLTAAVLLVAGGIKLAWAPAALLGISPFISYILSRTTGGPSYRSDIGNRSDWSGTMALLVEASIFVLATSILLTTTHAPAAQSTSTSRPPQPVG